MKTTEIFKAGAWALIVFGVVVCLYYAIGSEHSSVAAVTGIDSTYTWGREVNRIAQESASIIDRERHMGGMSLGAIVIGIGLLSLIAAFAYEELTWIRENTEPDDDQEDGVLG